MRLTALLVSAAGLCLGTKAFDNGLEVRQSPKPMPPFITQGVAIYGCTKPKTFALTFDDGATSYTNEVLDQLASANMKATFFVNGHNYDDLKNHQPELERMLKEGHQIGSHTQVHPSKLQLHSVGSSVSWY